MLTDRTSITTDWECGMKYWWYKCEGETGIVPTQEADYFLNGRDIHADLAKVATETPLDRILADIPRPSPETQIAMEFWTRRIAWVHGYSKYVWPKVREEFTAELIEKELILDRPPLWVACTPDLGLRSKRNRKLVYREFKTTGSSRAEWVLHWPYAVQIHIGLKAMEEEFGERVDYGNVMGLYNGYVYKGRLAHPYVWAYYKEGEWSHEYKYGWEYAPVWEYPDGIEAWVERLGEEGAAKVFTWSAPIFLNDRLLESLIRRRVEREKEIRRVKEAAKKDERVREIHFEQRFSHCRPPFGQPCPYLAACHNETVNVAPLRSGLYVPRTPHHELELIVDEGD